VREKIVVFTGAGVSAESGLKTFRDSGGLWHEHRIEDVATPAAWHADPATVLGFYNERRDEMRKARPNPAHEAIARLEEVFDVVVVTQNIDDLHERAGSTRVLHVHGEIGKSRSTVDPTLIYDLAGAHIALGDLCEHGSQLRPDVVWFGEEVRFMDESQWHIERAAKVLVVGTSLTVYPAAALLDDAAHGAEKYVVSPDAQTCPCDYRLLRGTAATVVPHVVACWLEGRSVN
jgi:NAD-dependent deacetylase